MNNLKKRDIGIDVLKCIAAILITNSHMDILYPNDIFATGGSIGNSLFFFASGFVLFLKPMGRFDNWYKKRINRIYPPVFAWAIVSTLFLDSHDDIIHIILYGGQWFVSCIMIYYVVIYFINQYMRDYLKLAWVISSLIVVVWYVLLDKLNGYDMNGTTYFKWGYYFLFMLMGAMIGGAGKQLRYRFGSDMLKLIGCVVLFYAILFGRQQYEILHQLQILALLPLLGATYYFYKVAKSNLLKQIYQHKIWGAIIKIIGGLCLEIYLVQVPFFTNQFNDYFPLNLIVTFVIILIAAYILRCISRVLSQIFKDEDLDWKEVFRLY